MPLNTATAAIDGQDTGGRLYVRCDQIQWLLTIDGGDEESGFTAMVDKGETPEAKFVKIVNLGGYTGSAGEGGSGDLEVSRDGSVLTFTGSAYGYFAADPSEPTTTGSRISTAC
ncbi:lipoprotein LpqH [Mycolicibacterium elephantis]